MASMGCKIALQQAAAQALAIAFFTPFMSAVVEFGAVDKDALDAVVDGDEIGVAFVLASFECLNAAAILFHRLSNFSDNGSGD
jgi:hypothetical protein